MSKQLFNLPPEILGLKGVSNIFNLSFSQDGNILSLTITPNFSLNPSLAENYIDNIPILMYCNINNFPYKGMAVNNMLNLIAQDRILAVNNNPIEMITVNGVWVMVIP